MEAIRENRIECILLVDDNEFTNIFNRRFLEKLKISSHVIAVKSGQEALDLILRKGKFQSTELPDPDLIFLDLNMPVMSGWEFMEEYEKLDVQDRKGKIIILTTSPNPEDEEKALDMKLISGYRKKPLTKEMIIEIIEKHFSN